MNFNNFNYNYLPIQVSKDLVNKNFLDKLLNFNNNGKELNVFYKIIDPSTNIRSQERTLPNLKNIYLAQQDEV